MGWPANTGWNPWRIALPLIRELAESDRGRNLAFFSELGKGKPHFYLFLASFSNLVEPHDQLTDINLPIAWLI